MLGCGFGGGFKITCRGSECIFLQLFESLRVKELVGINVLLLIFHHKRPNFDEYMVQYHMNTGSFYRITQGLYFNFNLYRVTSYAFIGNAFGLQVQYLKTILHVNG